MVEHLLGVSTALDLVPSTEVDGEKMEVPASQGGCEKQLKTTMRSSWFGVCTTLSFKG